MSLSHADKNGGVVSGFSRTFQAWCPSASARSATARPRRSSKSEVGALAGPFSDEIKRPFVAFPLEILLENPMKDRVLRRHEREQRDARSQLHVVRRPEN